MASGYDDLPIVFAEDGRTGELRHVDDVERGLACGCVCPACGQRLIARQGEKNAHSFAHRSGECKWAAEHVIAVLARSTVEERGMIALPPLSYADACRGTDVELTDAHTMRVASAELTEESGRGAPDLLVTVSGGGRESTFAVMLSLTHRATDSQLDSLCGLAAGVVVVDFGADMRERRKGLDRHHDREELAAAFQDPDFIASALLDEEYPFKSWVRNLKADAAARESAAKHSEEMKKLRDEEAARKREAEARRKAEREERARHEHDQGRPISPTDSPSTVDVGTSTSHQPKRPEASVTYSLPDVTVVAPSDGRYDVRSWSVLERDFFRKLLSNGDMDAMVTESWKGRRYDMTVDLDAEVLREVLSHLGELAHGCVEYALCVSASGVRYGGKLAIADGADATVAIRLESDDLAGALPALSELLSRRVKLSMTYRDAWEGVVGRHIVSVDVESRQVVLSRETLGVY